MPSPFSCLRVLRAEHASLWITAHCTVHGAGERELPHKYMTWAGSDLEEGMTYRDAWISVYPTYRWMLKYRNYQNVRYSFLFGKELERQGEEQTWEKSLMSPWFPILTLWETLAAGGDVDWEVFHLGYEFQFPHLQPSFFGYVLLPRRGFHFTFVRTAIIIEFLIIIMKIHEKVYVKHWEQCLPHREKMMTVNIICY